jgi:hypothetical protein
MSGVPTLTICAAGDDPGQTPSASLGGIETELNGDGPELARAVLAPRERSTSRARIRS